MARNNGLTTLQNATVAEKAKIVSGVNKLVALDGLPCDMLDCIAEQFIKNASTDELTSMKGTLQILQARISRALSERNT